MCVLFGWRVGFVWVARAKKSQNPRPYEAGQATEPSLGGANWR